MTTYAAKLKSLTSYLHRQQEAATTSKAISARNGSSMRTSTASRCSRSIGRPRIVRQLSAAVQKVASMPYRTKSSFRGSSWLRCGRKKKRQRARSKFLKSPTARLKLDIADPSNSLFLRRTTPGRLTTLRIRQSQRACSRMPCGRINRRPVPTPTEDSKSPKMRTRTKLR